MALRGTEKTSKKNEQQIFYLQARRQTERPAFIRRAKLFEAYAKDHRPSQLTFFLFLSLFFFLSLFSFFLSFSFLSFFLFLSYFILSFSFLFFSFSFMSQCRATQRSRGANLEKVPRGFFDLGTSRDGVAERLAGDIDRRVLAVIVPALAAHQERETVTTMTLPDWTESKLTLGYHEEMLLGMRRPTSPLRP
jgi:hypothetical protein